MRSSAAGELLCNDIEKLTAADGRVLDVEVISAPLSYHGEACTLSIIRDITARKKAEEDLKAAHDQLLKLNLELEERVAERTFRLAELDKELEAFSYSAAHDLKAPLRRINIFSELLEKEAGRGLNEEGRAHLFSIRKAISQMGRLVEGLLTLSTMEKNRWSLKLSVFPGWYGRLSRNFWPGTRAGRWNGLFPDCRR